MKRKKRKKGWKEETKKRIKTGSDVEKTVVLNVIVIGAKRENIERERERERDHVNSVV